MNIYEIIIASFNDQENGNVYFITITIAIFGTNCFKTLANFHLCMQ